MKRRLITFSLVCFAVAPVLHAAEIRFKDVIYLDEIHAKPLPLKVKHRVALTVSRDQSTILAMLPPGHTVWLLGFGPTRHYVETDIATGNAKGWVDIEAVEDVPEEIRGDVEERVRVARRYKELIEKHEVDIGMTRSQVQAALGKPDERTRTQEGDSVEEQWIYRTFKTIPQRDVYYVDGKLFERTYYKKVLAGGGKTVTIRNGEVVAIKEEDKLPEPSSPVIVAPPPLIHRY